MQLLSYGTRIGKEGKVELATGYIAPKDKYERQKERWRDSKRVKNQKWNDWRWRTMASGTRGRNTERKRTRRKARVDESGWKKEKGKEWKQEGMRVTWVYKHILIPIWCVEFQYYGSIIELNGQQMI